MTLKFLAHKLTSFPMFQIECASKFVFKPVLNSSLRGAGHSHWQNVKDTKELKDKIKNNNVKVVSNLVLKSIKDGNGIRDPKLNSRLASAIERARSLNVSMSSIEKLLSKSETVDPYIIEFQAPGGIFLLVETCNKHVTRERQTLQAILKRYGFKYISSSILNKIFNHRGEIICKSDKIHLISEDKALELALEIGAEEVKRDINSETGEAVYKFMCNPEDIGKIETALVTKGLVVESSSDFFDAINKVDIDDEMKGLVEELSNKLYESMETVQRIFINTSK